MSGHADYRWVKRNEDKPHRCPGCHSIALRAWSKQGYGRRTVLDCDVCEMKWRSGVHARRYPMRWKHAGCDRPAKRWRSA